MQELASNTTLDQLVNVVQELSLARDLDTIMKIVRRVARELTGADGATFILRDKDLCFYADENAISPLWKGQRFPMKACISGWAMIYREPVIIEDIYKDERIPIEAYRPTFVKSLAMVPIRTMDPIGAIGNYWATQRQPTEAEIKLLQSLADITAVAIENINVYAELEKRVKERTAQLEAANEALQSFSYSVSHDLRAPLRAISYYTQILEEDHTRPDDPEALKVLGSIQKNAAKMNQLIDDLLKFSSLGEKEIEKQEVDMNRVVQKVLDEIQTSAPLQAKIMIHSLAHVNADASLITQVWVNLISNAIKYSAKKDNPVVEIGCYEENNELIYFVRDNGSGFDMVYAHKLFRVFQRLHSHAEFEGTGIGLALVKRILHKHSGRVWANAKVDEGATFYFSLPTA